MDEVLQVIGKEGATWWENPHNPVIPTMPKKKILNYEAWMWLKLVVCNINPTRHETTLSMEVVLLIYALMRICRCTSRSTTGSPVDVPTPSAPSSPEPSRKELMRALRRNECIMRRHEQLMFMLHPELDTSGLEQISSPDISQNPQSQRAGSAEKGNAEEDDDFQSAEATGDATAYAGEESADDE
ncbi:hypothetical protein PIB30_100136 [Stylosanthes scabra]|uniref:Uncharacterized protein n=1 Tax=Stylosanthes scabra TaxID=79078 RepID=A0ABU6WVD0_9FABA|nr:hypothetical protein [Stylosanthes scabra]